MPPPPSCVLLSISWRGCGMTEENQCSTFTRIEMVPWGELSHWWQFGQHWQKRRHDCAPSAATVCRYDVLMMSGVFLSSIPNPCRPVITWLKRLCRMPMFGIGDEQKQIVVMTSILFQALAFNHFKLRQGIGNSCSAMVLCFQSNVGRVNSTM